MWIPFVFGGVAGAVFAAVTGGSPGEVVIAGVIGFATAGLSLPFQIGIEFLTSTQDIDKSSDKVDIPANRIPTCNPAVQSCPAKKEINKCGVI